MQGSKSNVGMIHTDCAKERKAETQASLINNLRALCDSGKTFFVKKVFYADGDQKEHMWIKVNAADVNFAKRHLKGVLDNDPEIVRRVKNGDTIQVHFEEIEQLYN